MRGNACLSTLQCRGTQDNQNPRTGTWTTAKEKVSSLFTVFQAGTFFSLGVLKRQRFRPGHPSCPRRGIMTLHPSSSSPVSTRHVRKVVMDASHCLCPGDRVGSAAWSSPFRQPGVTFLQQESPFTVPLLSPLLSWKICHSKSPLHPCLRMEATRTSAFYGPIHGKSVGAGWGKLDASEASSELCQHARTKYPQVVFPYGYSCFFLAGQEMTG